MPNFKLSRKAKADLRSIALYTERRWGREQRNHYILQFASASTCWVKIRIWGNLARISAQATDSIHKQAITSYTG